MIIVTDAIVNENITQTGEKMKQQAKNLLLQTLVRNANGEIGTLVQFIPGAWIVNWATRGLETVPLAIVQTFDLV